MRNFFLILLSLFFLAPKNSFTSSVAGGGSAGGVGLTELNGLTADPQIFSVGTAGTNFTITSASDTHTFDLPDASATARGVITTGAQTLAGAKTLSSAPILSALTASKPVCTDGSKAVTSTCTDLIPYASLDATNNYRVLSTDGSAAVIESAAITAARALISDANGIPTHHGTVSSTEIGYLDNATSELQTQINGKLPSTGVGLVEDISGHIETLANKTYYLRLNSSYAATINSISVDCGSGSADGELQIDGTPVTGCASTNIDFTTTEETETCSAANSVSAGNDITLVVTNNAAATDCRFTVKTTR